jgi:hypothetical protein|tara:strand:- start:58 stop:480 length:423 start_codon:yes stop_codon:yes gene_type:complete
MGRISRQISTGRPLEHCSSSHAQTLKENAEQAFGIPISDIDILENQNLNDLFLLKDNFMPVAEYKTKVKDEQEKIGRGLLKNYKEALNTSPAQEETYRNSLKDYFVLKFVDAGSAFVLAGNKADVDTAILNINWDSVVVP